jgi:hypothetical protein
MVVGFGIKKPILLLATICELGTHSGVRSDHLGEKFWDLTCFHHLVCLQFGNCQSYPRTRGGGPIQRVPEVKTRLGNCCQEHLRWPVQPAGTLKNTLPDCFTEIILHHASKVSCWFADHDHLVEYQLLYYVGALPTISPNRIDQGEQATVAADVVP